MIIVQKSAGVTTLTADTKRRVRVDTLCTDQFNARAKAFDHHAGGPFLWPPTKAKEFFEFFREQLEKIPEEFRGSAEIVFDGVGLRGTPDHPAESAAELVISYTRPETDEEARIRARNEELRAEELRAEELRAERVMARELAELARLREKYADK